MAENRDFFVPLIILYGFEMHTNVRNESRKIVKIMNKWKSICTVLLVTVPKKPQWHHTYGRCCVHILSFTSFSLCQYHKIDIGASPLQLIHFLRERKMIWTMLLIFISSTLFDFALDFPFVLFLYCTCMRFHGTIATDPFRPYRIWSTERSTSISWLFLSYW